MNNALICVIDDDPIYQIITKKIINKTNSQKRIISFQNGAEAIEFLVGNIHKPEELPNIILLDIDMPVMDGWDFIISFKKISRMISKKIFIYIVSSSIAESDKQKAKIFEEIDGYFSKPLTLENFKEIEKAND
jgi:CheY-like chemotaxis protein